LSFAALHNSSAGRGLFFVQNLEKGLIYPVFNLARILHPLLQVQRGLKGAPRGAEKKKPSFAPAHRKNAAGAGGGFLVQQPALDRKRWPLAGVRAGYASNTCCPGIHAPPISPTRKGQLAL
jgi:hypothetical protein